MILSSATIAHLGQGIQYFLKFKVDLKLRTESLAWYFTVKNNASFLER